MLTLLEIIKKTADFFAAKGIEHPRLDAELIIGNALGLKRMQLYLQFERLLTEPELENIRPLVRRRGTREPLQYVLGETEFFGLKLKTDRRALIPRPETERLVEIIVQQVTTPPGRVLDLGTGTGAIALALAKHWPGTRVTAVDASADALALANENAAALGLAESLCFMRSDWFAGLESTERFDLIAANPPYLSVEEVAQAAPEVREFEPAAALRADDLGRAELNKIISAAPGFLTPGGVLALETGIAQHAALLSLAAEKGFSRTESLPDLTGRDRYLLLIR